MEWARADQRDAALGAALGAARSRRRRLSRAADAPPQRVVRSSIPNTRPARSGVPAPYKKVRHKIASEKLQAERPRSEGHTWLQWLPSRACYLFRHPGSLSCRPGSLTRTPARLSGRFCSICARATHSRLQPLGVPLLKGAVWAYACTRRAASPPRRGPARCTAFS